MKIKPLSVVLALVLSVTAITADAQKKYTEGTITYKTDTSQEIAITEYFNSEFVATNVTVGSAKITQVMGAHFSSYALLLDVPAVGIKKAAILTSDEIEKAKSDVPSLTFAPTAETRQISGFNCKKVVATDTKTKATYDVWVTNDFAVPNAAMPMGYLSLGGVPVQYTAFQEGRPPSLLTMTSISDAKPPKGAFEIPADFERITQADLIAMMSGGQ